MTSFLFSYGGFLNITLLRVCIPWEIPDVSISFAGRVLPTHV